MRSANAGLSIHGNFVGGAAHADDLRTIATSKTSIIDQINIIETITSEQHLKLNPSKTEIIKISYCHPGHQQISLPSSNIDIAAEGKCLGVWWKHNLSASRSVQENIIKARKAFFAFGKIDAFQGNLNPLSAINIFETCVVPVLLYGSETWLLDSSTILSLEQFQYEIGRRILKVGKYTSGKAVRLSLNLPSMISRVLTRKLIYLGKLLSSTDQTISTALLTSEVIVDPFNTSLIQQCKMLETTLNMTILNELLKHPENASTLMKKKKREITKMDMSALLVSALQHKSAHLIARVAEKISWCKLWDIALDRGPHGTSQLQRIVHHLSRNVYDGFVCSLCEQEIDPSNTWLHHLCSNHSVTLNSCQLSQDSIVHLLCEEDDRIFQIIFP